MNNLAIFFSTILAQKSILLALTGYALIAIGQGIQKSQVECIQSGEKTENKVKKFLIWLLGIGFSDTGLFVIYKAISFGHASLVAALSACGLIVLFLFARFILNEKIVSEEIAGMVLILSGVILLPWRSLHHSPQYHINENRLLVFIFLITATLLILIFVRKREKKKVGTELALLAGSLTGASQLFQKISTTRHTTLLLQPEFYLFVLFFLGSFTSLQLAYRRHRILEIIPVFDATAVIVPLIGAMLFFRERLSLVQWGGIALILLGVSLIILANRKLSSVSS